MSLTQRFSRTGIMMIVVAVLYSSPAAAQIARVFLSGTGSDLNVCTDATTPCRSLQEAVNQCPIKAEIIVLTSGGFGTANITKSLTINAPAGVVAFNARTITVNVGASDKVVIRGLSLNGSIFGDPNGIYLKNGGTLIVENCLITGFVEGIRQEGGGSRLVVKNSEFRANTNDGVLTAPISATPTFATIEDCRFEDNGVGVNTGDYVVTVVRNSVATGNGRGYQLFSTTLSSQPFLMIDNCVASHNTFAGILVHGGADTTVRIRVTRSTIVGNLNGLVQEGTSQIISYGTNQLTNNGTDGVFFATVPTI